MNNLTTGWLPNVHLVSPVFFAVRKYVSRFVPITGQKTRQLDSQPVKQNRQQIRTGEHGCQGVA
jgi:hypothetical protein